MDQNEIKLLNTEIGMHGSQGQPCACVSAGISCIVEAHGQHGSQGSLLHRWKCHAAGGLLRPVTVTTADGEEATHGGAGPRSWLLGPTPASL